MLCTKVFTNTVINATIARKLEKSYQSWKKEKHNRLEEVPDTEKDIGTVKSNRTDNYTLVI